MITFVDYLSIFGTVLLLYASKELILLYFWKPMLFFRCPHYFYCLPLSVLFLIDIPPFLTLYKFIKLI